MYKHELIETEPLEMLHSTYLETSRLESSMHPQFHKGDARPMSGNIPANMALPHKVPLFCNYLKLAMIKRFPLLIMLMVWCIAFGNLKSVHGPCAKNTQDLQLPNLLLQPYSYPSCLKMPDMSWASIRTGNTPKRCWMSQDEKNCTWPLR